MHDALRERLRRQLESLPEEQLYQVLDYIEFLGSKYNRTGVAPAASGLQRFSERLEDKLRGNRVGFGAIRGTLEAVGTADRMMSGLAEAGRSLMREVEEGFRPEPPRSDVPSRREVAPPPKPHRTEHGDDIPVDG